MINRVAFLALAVMALLLAGCAGYKLGPTSGFPAGARSVQVNPFKNETMEPRLSAPVSLALRKALQQDGAYRLETRGDGDIIVHGVITRFHRGGVAFQPGDIVTVRDYNLSLTAHITATERITGRTIFDGPVSGHTIIRVGNDLASAERQAIPLLANDLARNATSVIADGAW
jgi:hypothetical protein